MSMLHFGLRPMFDSGIWATNCMMQQAMAFAIDTKFPMESLGENHAAQWVRLF